MTSVAASVFASLTQALPSDGIATAAQPATGAFGAVLSLFTAAPPAGSLGDGLAAFSSGSALGLLTLPKAADALSGGPATAPASPAGTAMTTLLTLASDLPKDAPTPVTPAEPLATAVIPATPPVTPQATSPAPATPQATPAATPPVAAAPAEPLPTIPPVAASPADPSDTAKPIPPASAAVPVAVKPTVALAKPLQAPSDAVPSPKADETPSVATAEVEETAAHPVATPLKTDRKKAAPAVDEATPPVVTQIVLTPAPLATLASAAPPALVAAPVQTNAPATKTTASGKIASAAVTDVKLPSGDGPHVSAANQQIVPKADTGAGTGSGHDRDHAASQQGTALPVASADAPPVLTVAPSFQSSLLHPLARAADTPPTALPASITAQPGRIGQELGVAIAHHVSNGGATGGGETITLRLEPVDMGRIEVKLSFDDHGTLRAIVSADTPAALEMLRRDSADLGRALSDAGVRADTQTLRFDSRSGGQSGNQGGENGQSRQRQPDAQPTTETAADTGMTETYRPLRTRGGVDLVA